MSLAHRLDRIDAYLIGQYTQHRREKVCVISVNRELMTLRRLLHVAAEWNLIRRVPNIRLLTGERQRTFVLSHADETKYLGLAPQPLRDAALLMLDTGLRVGEAVKLQWTDVELKASDGAPHGYVVVKEGKSKYSRRAIPLTVRVNEMLSSRLPKKDSKSTWVFPANTPEGHVLVASPDHLHSEVARPKVKGKTVYRFSRKFVLHSFRHTMLTRLGEAGAEAFTIQRIAGHSSVTVSQRYVHPTSETVGRALQRLDTLNAEQAKLAANGSEVRQLPATIAATAEAGGAVSH